MRKLLVSSYFLFSAGFILKFFHIHYNAVLMLTALAIMLIINIISLFKKQDRFNALIHFGIWTWLVVLLISIKFFHFANIALIIAVSVSVLAMLMAYKNKKLIKLTPIVVLMIIALVFFNMPTDQRYYLISIKWNHEIKTDYQSLDKYSWFLYQNNKYREALDVSNQAMDIAIKAENDEWIDFIIKHNKAIVGRNWNKFR